jgi:hypothetical protein
MRDPLPEEQAAGTDDPEGQAAAILEESEQRIVDRDAAPGSRVDRRTSADATDTTGATGTTGAAGATD